MAARVLAEEPKHDTIKWDLLHRIKSTVDVLLASRNTNIWSTYGGLSRLLDDLEGIFRHGLKACQDFFGESQDYDIVLKDGGLCGRVTDGKTWMEQTLLQHLMTYHVEKLLENSQLIKNYYHDCAYLRSEVHCQALCTCLKAVENNDPGLLTQINSLLVNKEKHFEEISEKEASHPTSTVLLEEKNPKYNNEDGKTFEENESSYSLGFTECERSERSDNTDACDVDKYEDDIENENSEIEIIMSSDEDLTNIDINALDTNSSHRKRSEFLDNHEMVLAREKLYLKRLKLVDSKKIKRNINQGTLAHVALSVVMENDERSSSPSEWFDGGSTLANRRSSSLNEVDISRNDECEIHRKTGLTGKESNNVSSEHKSKKAIGHTRSKSDGKSTQRQLSLKETTRIREPIYSNPESQSRLSSSLPENSATFYLHDPLSPTPEEQSLATMLASQDLTSCELEKENAHFSISEALIQAIEQMKCDQIIASEDEEEEDEDDEEIQHLKLEIERRRLEKKREKLRDQPAFSDEKSTSNHSSDLSTRSSSSFKSSILDTDDISPDWEEISFIDEATGLVGLSGSVTTLVPETEDPDDHFATPSIESSTSPLSAEAVAKSLLKKFANKKHPAASELQWLVSENDVPQSLLPLPQAYSVAPDDVREQDDTPSIERRSSLPCRMRGNLEWAPPRSQIIFHVHPAPRRKQLMEDQNYRCTGCGMQVDPGYMKRFRYCNYLGKYFCSSCHHNSIMVIPARIVRKWDFKKYGVSRFSMDLINKIFTDPLFNIKDLNPSLYSKVNQMETIKNLRRQLYYLRSFAQTCRKSKELQRELSRIPNHLLIEEHLYSLQDLLQVKSGELLVYLKNLVTQSLLHVEGCPLCQAKGFICEYCRNGDDIIFPFQLNKAYQCPNCRASFHKDCYVMGKCPKCERIRIRKSLLAAPIPKDDE